MFGKPATPINIPGIVEIPQCGLYATSQYSLDKLLSYFKEEGYEVKSMRESGYGGDGYDQHEVDVSKPCYLWYASIRQSVHKGKCLLCGKYIPLTGTRSHGKKCPECGGLIYADLVDGVAITFFFTGNHTDSPKEICMRIRGYDEEQKLLLLYPDPLDSKKGFFVLKPDKARKCLEDNGAAYTVTSEGFISIPYTSHGVGVINTCDIERGSGKTVNNVETVKVWRGKEYGEWDDLPVAEYYSVYEAWRWAPLAKSPKLHEKIIGAAGMVSSCDYYTQDGSQAFCDIHLERMRIFVENFTSLDIKEWDAMIEEADLSGPGMIRAVAGFCSDNPEIRDEPNVWNAIHALGKTMAGQVLTEGEIRAAHKAVSSPRVAAELLDLTKFMRGSQEQ